MEIINLDMTPSTVTPNAHAGQYDASRTVRFMLKNGGVPFTLAGTETITAEITRSDNTEVTVNVTNTSSNYVDVVFDDTVCTVKGLYACELRIKDGDVDIGSKNFALLVQRDPYDGAGVHVETVGPADICTFETTLPEPLQSVLVNVVATGGNGTPDNPTPIVGYTEANITRCGVNLYSDIFSEYRKPVNYFIKNVPLEAGKVYTLKATLKDGGTAVSGCYFGVASKGEQYSEFLPDLYPCIKTDGTTATSTLTVTSSWTSPKLCCYISDETQFNSIFENYDVSLTEGTADFTLYNGQTFTLAFGQTVYGGVLDVTRGKLKPCIEYPSYNGETLSGRWLSSEATYIEGTTPPIGSQVVSLDDYGSDIDLTPEVIEAVVGTNNVFADCGETTVKYLKAGA